MYVTFWLIPNFLSQFYCIFDSLSFVGSTLIYIYCSLLHFSQKNHSTTYFYAFVLDTRVFVLKTTSILRKYLSILDLPFAYLTSKRTFVSTPLKTFYAWVCMLLIHHCVIQPLAISCSVNIRVNYTLSLFWVWCKDCHIVS